MITATFRVLPALALLIGGGIALDAWRRREREHRSRQELHEDLHTWEGEGGNLPTGPATGSSGNPSTGPATGSSGGLA